MTPLFIFDRATLIRTSGTIAIRELTWSVHESETWAIVGPVGSGKTTLAETIMGSHRLTGGTVTWPVVEEWNRKARTVSGPTDSIRFVSFQEQSSRFSYARHYYQQRFNFIDPEDDLTLDEFLRDTGLPREDELRAVTERLGISHLRPLSFIKLSNGQTRRARIAKALLGRPEWLILDEPFLGLDQSGRADLTRYLDLVRQSGTRLIVISRPDCIPYWVTHVLELGRREGTWAGPRSNWTHSPAPPVVAAENPEPTADREPVIELTEIRVRHGGTTILNGLDWTVRAGERWALTGPNGSGKSTLLSLIYGDHPQAYSNDVKLFGKARGTGESIWDVKKRIGYVSPEFHLYFSEPLTAFRTATTGFFDGTTDRPTTQEQEAIVRDFFREFGIAALSDRPFRQLSTGQQRLVLLVRSLVKRPDILLLDEPFQGFDPAAVAHARAWLDERLSGHQALIFVGHDPAEMPRSITRRFQLEGGTARLD